MHKLALAAASALALASAGNASAQTPSADDIIAGLQPTHAQLVHGATRGIRPATIVPDGTTDEPSAAHVTRASTRRSPPPTAPRVLR